MERHIHQPIIRQASSQPRAGQDNVRSYIALCILFLWLFLSHSFDPRAKLTNWAASNVLLFWFHRFEECHLNIWALVRFWFTALLERCFSTMRNTLFCTRIVLMLRVHRGNKVETSQYLILFQRKIMCEERIYFVLRLETIQPVTHLFYWPKLSFRQRGKPKQEACRRHKPTHGALDGRPAHSRPRCDCWYTVPPWATVGGPCDTLKPQAFCRKIHHFKQNWASVLGWLATR